jgi:hypothetical protein
MRLGAAAAVLLIVAVIASIVLSLALYLAQGQGDGQGQHQGRDGQGQDQGHLPQAAPPAQPPAAPPPAAQPQPPAAQPQPPAGQPQPPAARRPGAGQPPVGQPPPPAQPPAAEPPPPAQPPPAAAEFAERCNRNINSWQRGRTFFPQALTVKLEESRTYAAGIDISGSNDLRDRLPNDIIYGEAPVEVRCGLGARLKSTSPMVQVDETDWVMLEFDETGQLQWTWTITGKKPGDGDLNLELRPAVAVIDGGYVVPAGDTDSPTTVFHTKLEVTATWTQHLYLWWDANWGKLSGIVIAIGAAVAGSRAWLRKFRGPGGKLAAAGIPKQPQPAGGRGRVMGLRAWLRKFRRPPGKLAAAAAPRRRQPVGGRKRATTSRGRQRADTSSAGRP